MTATGAGLVTTTIYLGTDLDDAEVWARAVRLRAREVLVLPDQDVQLGALLTAHLSRVLADGHDPAWPGRQGLVAVQIRETVPNHSVLPPRWLPSSTTAAGALAHSRCS